MLVSTLQSTVALACPVIMITRTATSFFRALAAVTALAMDLATTRLVLASRATLDMTSPRTAGLVWMAGMATPLAMNFSLVRVAATALATARATTRLACVYRATLDTTLPPTAVPVQLATTATRLAMS